VPQNSARRVSGTQTAFFSGAQLIQIHPKQILVVSSHDTNVFTTQRIYALGGLRVTVLPMADSSSAPVIQLHPEDGPHVDFVRAIETNVGRRTVVNEP
jgi:hypothetical protein